MSAPLALAQRGWYYVAAVAVVAVVAVFWMVTASHYQLNVSWPRGGLKLAPSSVAKQPAKLKK